MSTDEELDLRAGNEMPFAFVYPRRLLESGWLASMSGPQARMAIALLAFADRRGVMFPGLNLLATKLGVKRRHVERVRASMVKAGYLEVAVPSRGYRPTKWRLVMPPEYPGTPGRGITPAHQAVIPRRTRSPNPGAPGRNTPAQPTGLTVQEQFTNGSSNRGTAAAAISLKTTARDALISEHGEAAVTAAEVELQRRIKSGEHVINPGGLLRTMLCDGYIALPSPVIAPTLTAAERAVKQSIIEKQKVIGLADLEEQRRIAAAERKKSEAAQRIPIAPSTATIATPPVNVAARKIAFIGFLADSLPTVVDETASTGGRGGVKQGF